MPRALTATSIAVSALLGAAFVLVGAQSASAVTPDCTGIYCSVTFNSTGGVQLFVVPAGVTSVTVSLDAAEGGAESFGGDEIKPGGLGGETIVATAVSPGDLLAIVVGGQGASVDITSGGTPTGGYGGGGIGATAESTAGAGGGGGSFLFDNSGTLIAAAGGGGGSTPEARGGDGGGVGTPGTSGQPGSGGSAGGGAATEALNGDGGAMGANTYGNGGPGGDGSGTTTSVGEFALGGSGGTGAAPGGGGGGGYHAGGGGGGEDAHGDVTGAGGGGGSGYAAASVSSSTASAGVHQGNGLVGLSYTLPAATVSFNSEGGSAVSNETIAQGTAATAPSDPTRTGYGFDGWFTQASGGTQWNFGTTISSDTALYAQWTLDSETVTFASEGGSSVASQSVSYGDPAVGPGDPTRVGFTFDGWFTAASGGSQWDFATAIDADTTLYAQWTGVVPTVTISSPNVAQGGTLTVTGSGFAASQSLDISIHSTPVHLATVDTDGAGGLSTSVTIPKSLSTGSHTLVITGAAAGPVDVAVTVTAANSPGLAFTGTNILPILLAALALVLAGGAITVFRLRRRLAIPKP